MIRNTYRTPIIIAAVFIVTSISIAIGDNGSNDASVGYITNIEIVERTQTSHWEGYYGIIIAESSSVYPYYFNKSTDISTIRKLELGATVQEGDLIFITNSRKAPVLSELRAGKISTIDAITGKYSDSGTRTFTSNSSYLIPSTGKTINDVPTAYTFVDSKQQVESFREGLFRDNEGNLILIVPISSAPKHGYDNASYFFQFIVPNSYSNPQKYYMYYVTSPTKKAHTKKGTIIVNKKALGGDAKFKFTMTGGDNMPASFIITTSGGAGSETFTNVKPGITYNITETVPSGWILTASSSTTGTPSSFIVGAGQTVTVNFTDTAKNGTIIVNKITVGGEGSFSFTGIGDSRLRAGFRINTSSGHGTMTFTNVTPGEGYGIFETVPAGWILTSSKSSTATSVGKSGRFAVAPGDTVYVNFTDTRFPRSIVTDSSLSFFDLNHIHNNGQQFRLIFTTNPVNKRNYKLTESNPDQIYYNVFYIGSPKANVSLNITIPYPFVTDGSYPIRVYSKVSIHDGNFVPSGSFEPSDEITRKFTITGTKTRTSSGKLGIKLTDYNSSKQSVTITVTGPVPTSGLVYVNLHLDYGLTGTANYMNARNDDALNASNPGQVVIPNNGSYIFRVSGSMIDNQTILNENVFNRIPGIRGKVVDKRSNPKQGVKVQVYNSDHKLLATVYTDHDGFYSYSYKHTGKEATFTVKLPDYNLQHSVAFKEDREEEADLFNI